MGFLSSILGYPPELSEAELKASNILMSQFRAEHIERQQRCIVTSKVLDEMSRLRKKVECKVIEPKQITGETK